MSKPRFTWSYSAMSDFNNCPLAYAHKRYYKDVVEEQKEHLIEGTRVHKALERELKGDPTLPEHADVIAKHRKYTDVMKASAEGGEIHAELELAITEDMTPTEWFGADAWGRGVVDAVIIKNGVAYIYDWKTGKVKDDDLQLKTFCAFLSLFRPDIEHFVAKFIWLKFDKITGFHQPMPKTNTSRIWSDLILKVQRMKQAWDSEVWQAKPSGLCPWCPYHPKCKYRR